MAAVTTTTYRKQVERLTRGLAAADQHVADLCRENGELSRDLALAESRIEQLERQLVAVGVMDPELGP